jgi:energy-coupling factor transporter transmembrane protein EcfT
MRKIYQLLANTLFILHGLLVVFILLGWLFPSIKIIYLVVLLLWLFSWIFLGYCPPTKWEFLLRRKYDKSIDPNAEAVQYYMYKFFKKDVPSKTIFTTGIIIFIILVILSLLI